MTLAVKQATRGLHLSVLAALEEIAPGSSFALRDDGTVVRDVEGRCGAYCTHRAGCNMVDALVAAAGTVTVELSGYSSEYHPDRGSDPVAGTVFWDPTQAILDADRCGGTRTRSSVVLAHELVHALQDQLGTLDYMDRGEFEAIRGENQIRAEMCEPLRVRYGGDTVPRYDTAYLDVRDHRGCGCGDRESPGGRLERELRCSVRTALRCILQWLERPEPVAFTPHSGSVTLRRAADEAGDVLAARIRTAEATRAASAHASLVHRLAEESLARDPFTVCLEAVGLSAAYGAVLIRPVEQGLSVLTDFVFQQGETLFARGPTDLVDQRRTAPERLPAVLGDLRFEPGVGGRPWVMDGAVQFLTLKLGDRILATALYGYGYPIFRESTVAPPERDQARWSAVNRIYELTRQLLDGPSREARLVLRAES